MSDIEDLANRPWKKKNLNTGSKPAVGPSHND